MKLEIPMRVPRKYDPNLEKYWNLVRLHGSSRKKMAEFICDIGGYSDRSDRFAIEFNISADRCNLDFDHLLERYRKGDGDNVIPKNPAHAAIYERCFKEAYDEAGHTLWSEACEEAYRGWAESDTPYENWTGVRVEWEWEIRGRSGKHLCMTECEGINLKVSPEDLFITLLERESDDITASFALSTERMVKLFILCVANTVWMTRDNIGDEVERNALWLLCRNAEADAEPLCDEYDQRKELEEPANDIRELLVGHVQSPELAQAFDTICKFAGLTP